MTICVCERLKFETKGRGIGRLQFPKSGFTMRNQIEFLDNGKISQKRNTDQSMDQENLRGVLVSLDFIEKFFKFH